MTLYTEVKLTDCSMVGIKRECHGEQALKIAGAPMPAGKISPTTQTLAAMHRDVLNALYDEF
jgi:hypothetical protein